MKTFERKLAQGISIIGHPLLMPSYIAIIIFHTDKYLKYAVGGNATWNLVALIFILTFMFPVSMMMILKFFKLIDDFELKEQKQRTLPYLITGIFYYFAYHLLSKFTIALVDFVLIGGAISVFLTLLINLKWKISAHMVGIGCFTGMMLMMNIRYMLVSYWLIIFSFFIAGIIGSARLKLKAHSPAQVYSGFIVGVLSLFLWVGAFFAYAYVAHFFMAKFR